MDFIRILFLFFYLVYLFLLHGFFKEPIIGPLKSKMADIRHLDNRHDVIFSAEGGPIWITFRRLVQNDMSTAPSAEG